MARRSLGIWLTVLLSMVALAVPSFARADDAVTVSAATAGTKEVGATTNIWGTAVGAADSPVSVQVLLADQSWSTSQVGTTSASGFYALPLTYGRYNAGTYSFRAVVTVASDVYVVSPTVTLTRTQGSVSAATAGAKAVGVATNIWGTASGAPNRRVAVQVLVNGAWSTSQVGTTSASGFYALPLTYGRYNAGTYSFRAVVTVASGVYVVSPTATLTRTATNAYYANCTAARAAGAAPIFRGQPGYSSALDRDGDGIACEWA